MAFLLDEDCPHGRSRYYCHQCGQAPTPDGNPRPSYTCPRCGATSYSPHDIAEGYCGSCHDWTAQDEVGWIYEL
jgi:ribosomal protein S27AE